MDFLLISGLLSFLVVSVFSVHFRNARLFIKDYGGSKIQKNPRAHNRHSPPLKKNPKYHPPTPKRRNFLAWVFPAERTHLSRRP